MLYLTRFNVLSSHVNHALSVCSAERVLASGERRGRLCAGSRCRHEGDFEIIGMLDSLSLSLNWIYPDGP